MGKSDIYRSLATLDKILQTTIQPTNKPIKKKLKIDRIDPEINLNEKTSQRVLKESMKHNIPKIDAILEKYK